MKKSPTTLINTTLFNDRTFPGLSIKKFVATELGLPEDVVVETLFHALPDEKQTAENKQFIEKAMLFTVNASGAVILMVNTNDGIKLVYGNSQRRKKVISSNGACEENESMAQTAIREFCEELGNPPEKGILCGIMRDANNCRSLGVSNKIGKSAEEIASRIVETKADKNRLYFNISALYVNEVPVNITALSREIETLNVKLTNSAPYYNAAVMFVFGDRASGKPAADLTDISVKIEACKLITRFQENCRDNISSNFHALFELNYDHNTTAETVKSALLAIIDLTENNSLGLISKAELESLLTLLNQKGDLSQFKKEFFAPSFENLLPHQGEKTPSEFLDGLQKLALLADKIALPSLKTEEDTQTTRVEPRGPVNN